LCAKFSWLVSTVKLLQQRNFRSTVDTYLITGTINASTVVNAKSGKAKDGNPELFTDVTV